jgi:hypothetical protein
MHDYGEHIKKNDMGGSCSMYRRGEQCKCFQKFQEIVTLEKYSTWYDNIKIDIKGA